MMGNSTLPWGPKASAHTSYAEGALIKMSYVYSLARIARRPVIPAAGAATAAPATSGDATEVPESARQPPPSAGPNTRVPAKGKNTLKRQQRRGQIARLAT